MVTAFLPARKKLIVAISFDEHTMPLIRSGVAMAQKTGKTLSLVHVTEPWIEASQSRPFADVSPLWDVTQAVQQNAKELAYSRLQELKSEITSVPVDVKVLSGSPADCLGAEALANDACMILVGAGRSTNKFIPGGFSTAYSLMAHSPVPICVYTKELETTLQTSYTLVAADDLGETSENAVDFAFDLADMLGKSTLYHVHVNGLTVDALRVGLDTARGAARTAINDSLTAEEIHKTVLEKLEAKLASRTQGKEEYIESGSGQYVPEVLTGVVSEELYRLANDVKPDFMVFGRHHIVHRKPFFLGNLPFRSMLAGERPVIVVPD